MSLTRPDHLELGRLRIEHRTIELAKLTEIIALAKESDVTRSRLLQLEHVAYQLAWCEITNPDHKDHANLGISGGPDITTPLLMNDATAITVVDRASIAKSRIEQAQVPTSGYDGMFQAAINTKRCLGYYSEPAINDPSIGMERLLVNELHALGISDDIEITETEDGVTIDFEWKYPGQHKAKPRKINYQTMDLHQLPNSALIKPESLDSVTQKAAFQARIYDNPKYLNWLKNSLALHGYLFLDILKPERDENPRGIDRHFSDTRKLFQSLPPGFKVVALDKTILASIFKYSTVELGYGTYIVAAQRI